MNTLSLRTYWNTSPAEEDEVCDMGQELVSALQKAGLSEAEAIQKVEKFWTTAFSHGEDNQSYNSSSQFDEFDK